MFIGSSLWNNLYYVTTTLFQVAKKCIVDNVRNRLLTSTFQLRTKIRYSYFAYWVLILGLRFVWYVCKTYWNKIEATFLLCLPLWRIFYYVRITLFVFQSSYVFMIRLELRYILVSLKCLRKLRVIMVIF